MTEVIDREEQSTELVTLPPKETAMTVYSTPGGLDPLIEQVREKVVGTVYDMTTAKGRAECASDAFKVARSKTAIEKLGKALSAEHKEIPKRIDAERRRAFDALEALQKEVRQPLTDWEQAEQQRINEHQQALKGIADLAASATPETTADILRDLLNFAEQVEIGPHWEEFEAQAARTKDSTVSALRTALAAREKYEAEQAELAKLRDEAEARAKRDEEERIAREAAERATREAEAKAQAEREAAAQREAQAKAAAEQAERDRLEAVERQKQAEARAEAEKLAAEQRAKDAAEAARLAEIKRHADEAARIAAETAKREADREHKSKIMGAAKEGLMAAGITEEQARNVVRLINACKVPNVRIHF